MKIRILLILMTFILINRLSAQYPARAIVFSKGTSDDILVRTILDEIDKRVLINSEKFNLVLYHTSDSKSLVTPHPQFKDKEKPCSEIIFFSPNIYFNRDPQFEITVDTLGNTTDAFFVIGYGASLNTKAIDLATSKILKFSKNVILKNEQERFQVKDFKKEFGGDPNKILKTNSDIYYKIVEKLKKDYKPKISEYYKSKVDGAMIYRWFSPEDFAADEKIFEIIPLQGLTDKKVKEFKFNGGIKDNLVKGRNYICVVKRVIEGYYYYEDLTRVQIKEIGESESTMSTLLWGSKDLAESLKNGEKVLLIPEDVELVYRKLNDNNKHPKVTLAINKRCMFCDETNETFLMQSPIIELIERSAPELKYFAELAKKENYIDYSIEDLQGKKVGLDLYLIKSNKFLDAIEVASNKNIASIDLSFKFLGLTGSGYLNFNVLSRILNAYKPDVYNIEMIKIIEEKKDKIEKILAYNPIGFDVYSKYDIYTLIDENVDGEIIKRKNKIGECRPNKLFSTNLAEISIKDGKNELFKALKQNEKVYFFISLKD